MGYFQRGKKKKDKDEKDELDMFQSSKEEDEFAVLIENELNESDILKKASDFIKMFKKKKST